MVTHDGRPPLCDRHLWTPLHRQRRAAEQRDAAEGTPPRPVRRLRVPRDSSPYGSTLLTLAVTTAEHTVLLYLIATDRTITVECTQADALATLLNADPGDTAAGFTVARDDAGTFTITCDGHTATLTRDHRAEVIAFLMP